MERLDVKSKKKILNKASRSENSLKESEGNTNYFLLVHKIEPNEIANIDTNNFTDV